MILFMLSSALYGLAAAAIFYVLTARLSRGGFAPIAPAIAIAILGVASLAVFWTVFLAPFLAAPLNVAFWLGAVAALFLARRAPFDREAAAMAALWAAGAVILLFLAFAPTGVADVLATAKTRWSHSLPGDNEIPLVFAKHLKDGHIPTPMYGDWLSSDRPPLQSGYYLLTAPEWLASPPAYQIAATGAQMLVLPAAYHFARVLGAGLGVALIGAALVFLAPLTLVNGIFVWPKLLAAAFLLAAAAIHFTPCYEALKSSRVAGASLGALAAAAFLSHGAAAFAILGFALAALATRRLGSFNYVAAAAGAALLLCAPWALYQKLVDPPGDRLLKWHLAGVEAADDPRSAGEAIREAYAELGAGAWARRQGEKLRTSLAAPLAANDLFRDKAAARADMFFRPIPSMGFAGIFAAAGLVAALVSRRLRPAATAILAGYGAWLLVMFEAGGVIAHQASYFMLTAPLVLLAAGLSTRPLLLYALLAGQIATAARYYFL